MWFEFLISWWQWTSVARCKASDRELLLASRLQPWKQRVEQYALLLAQTSVHIGIPLRGFPKQECPEESSSTLRPTEGVLHLGMGPN